MIVHRATRGQRDVCLRLMRATSEEDPFHRWLGDASVCKKYHRYVFAHALRTGRVVIAQPRAGVGCALPVFAASWSLVVGWAHLRFRQCLSHHQRSKLDAAHRLLTTHASPGDRFLWYLGVRSFVRSPALSRDLLQKLIGHPLTNGRRSNGLMSRYRPGRGPRDGTRVWVQTARPSLVELILRKGGTCRELLPLGEGTVLHLLSLPWPHQHASARA